MFFIKKVLLLFGGKSHEHLISCMSCASVAENIDDSLFFYKLVGIDLDNNWYEYTGSIDNLKSGDWKYSVIPISDESN